MVVKGVSGEVRLSGFEAALYQIKGLGFEAPKGFSCLCFLSCHRIVGITDVCHHISLWGNQCGLGIVLRPVGTFIHPPPPPASSPAYEWSPVSHREERESQETAVKNEQKFILYSSPSRLE